MFTRILLPFLSTIILALGATGMLGSYGASDISVHAVRDARFDKLMKLDTIAESLYTASYSHNRQAAYSHLLTLKRYLEDEIIQQYGAEDGWRLMIADADKVERALTDGQPDMNWLEQVTRIRLAVDAMVRPDRALWLPYEQLLRDDVSSIRQAWHRGDGSEGPAAAAMLHRMHVHANRIEAAANIAGHQLRMRELMERIQYGRRILVAMEKQGAEKLRPISNQEVERTLATMDNVISAIYSGDDGMSYPAIASPEQGKPLRWIFMIGTMISAVLTLVGWRKYRTRPYGIKPIA
ncbi:sporulation protein YpjB [Paenibacillus chungangensis]|uniref:Sporulation protein YpjB n=1 Tax=Paenibacillus chungangensis TaxID=696535 RepID=A0ABW3HMV1_9BACL